MTKLLRVSICALDIRHTTPRSAFNLDDNLRAARDLLRRAAAQGADLAFLPEVFAVQNHPRPADAAEPLDGPVLSALADAARSLGIGVTAGHLTIEDGRLYNSLVLLDRSGRIITSYHKMFPTISELEWGVAPGTGPLVLDTPFGRLGFAICYDLNFAELRLAYRDLRPELILFASAFRGGLQTNWWAYETRSYLLSSVIDPRSVIVNPLGRTIADTSTWTRLLTCTLNLDYAVVHYDYANRNLADVSSRFGKDFDFEWAEPEGVFLVTAKGKDPASSLVRRAGWEPVEDYFARSRRLRDRALAGEPIEKGPAPW